MQHILYSVFSYSMCQCYVTCLVYINKHTPLTHIQRLFYRNWCNKTSLLQTPPSLHPRALIGLTRQHLVSHWCLHVSVRAWSLSLHMEGMKPRWHQLKFCTDFLEHRTESTFQWISAKVRKYSFFWDDEMFSRLYQAAG